MRSAGSCRELRKSAPRPTSPLDPPPEKSAPAEGASPTLLSMRGSVELPALHFRLADSPPARRRTYRYEQLSTHRGTFAALSLSLARTGQTGSARLRFRRTRTDIPRVSLSLARAGQTGAGRLRSRRTHNLPKLVLPCFSMYSATKRMRHSGATSRHPFTSSRGPRCVRGTLQCPTAP